jgi:ATP-dependent DNA ligase
VLPTLAPMLAVPTRPFDSPDFLFEIKWDGVRALAALEDDGWRLWGRGQTDYTSRYPELARLRRWPAGTLLDGELLALHAGRPDLARLLQRHGLVDAWKIRRAAQERPVHYVVFDLLFLAGRRLLEASLTRRRALLRALCEQAPLAGVELSLGVESCGRALYEAALSQGQEGVMAKALGSPYRPGRRSAAWRKIKPPGPRPTRPTQGP